MNTREHAELFRYLMAEYCQLKEDLLFVDDVSEWCKKEGIDEPDRDKPLRVLVKTEGQGCRLVVGETLPEDLIERRLKALSIRGTILNVAEDRADMLDSERKKLAYLFLSEFAKTFPDMAYDELLADDWAFKEMEKLGFFKESKVTG